MRQGLIVTIRMDFDIIVSSQLNFEAVQWKIEARTTFEFDFDLKQFNVPTVQDKRIYILDNKRKRIFPLSKQIKLIMQ